MPLGEKVGDAYVRITSDGSGIDEGIRDGLRDADGDVKRGAERHADTYGKSFEKGLGRRRVALALAKNLHRARTDPVFQKAADDLGKHISKLISKGQDNKWINRTIKDMHRLSDSTDGVGRSMGRHAVAFTRFRGRVTDLDDGLIRFSQTSGRLTGRGSRNNFIHFFGGLVGGLTSTLRIVPRLAQGFLSLVRVGGEMRTAFGAAGGGFRGLAAAGSVGGRAFASLAASGVALGAALAALVVIIGPMVALISGLVAAVTALAGSLTLAAAAAGGALLGALLPLAAGAGVVAAAFIGMDKAQKRLLSNSFKPLTREFSGLGDVARKTLVTDIGRSATGLAPVIRGLRPLVHGVAMAMGDVFQNFSHALQGSGFVLFKRDMEAFLPNAVRSLGGTFVNVFGGLGGLFRSLIPLTNRFLSWINRITGDFSKWINTSAGQAKMIGFFQRAGDSARSVGNFLREGAKALGTLLGMGARSGNNIFDSMANSLQRFTSYLNSNPGAVQKWFANGVETAKAIGSAIQGIASVIRSLDTETNRTFAVGALKGFALMLRVVAGAISGTAFVLSPLVRMLGNFVEGIGHAMNAVDKFTMFSDPFKGVGDSLVKTGKSLGMVGLKTEEAGRSASRATGGYANFKASTAGLADSLDQVSGAATRATRELVRQKLISTGLSAATKSYGVSMRDLIGAATGNARAQRAVNAALKDGDPATRALRGKLAALGVEFNKAGRIVRTRAADLQTWGQALKGIKDRRVRVAIRETGMQPTIGKFKQLIRQQKLTPRQVRIAAKALNVDLTSKQLNRLIKDAKNLGKQRPKPKADVDNRSATRKFKQSMADSNKFDRQKPRPTVDVRNTPAMNGLSRVAAKMRDVDRSSATPHVRVSSDLSGGYAAQRLLGSLHDKSLTITTHMKQVRSASGRIVEGGVGDKFAVGGILSSLTNFTSGIQAAESGREAIVPLNRPLAQVDPSVRWLSALAQGKGLPGMGNTGKVVNVGGLTVITPTKDPLAVATEAVNKLVGSGY